MSDRIKIASNFTFGHHKCRNGRGSHCRADGVTLLGCVDPAVPAAPGFGGSKHATTTTHLDYSQGFVCFFYLYRLNKNR